LPDLRTILDLNRDIILFGYGLVFFVMGLAIALQSRHYSRLELALSLKWLAAFGVTHGLHEWGDLFIPIQRAYLSQPVVQALYILQLFLLGASFACLFEFGLALLRPIRRAAWLHGVSISLLLSWLFVIFFILLPFIPDLTAWRHTANALARYFIGFPAGLLAAFGLRHQTYRRIAPLNVPHIVNTLRVAGLALFFYGLLAGLIPPAVVFFPGNIVNTSTFTQVVGVSPLLFRSLTGLVLAITIIRALEVFELETERLIETMEQQQILTAERERIGREMHDGAIQKVYTAGLLIQSAVKLAGPDNLATPRLDKAVEVLDDAISDLRHSLGELRETADDVTLSEGLRRLENDPRFQSLVEVDVEIELPEEDTLSSMRTSHVLAIVSEALSNVARHAHAQRVKISAFHESDRLILSIQDDGSGLPRDLRAGYGLRNMRDRARLLGGQIDIGSVDGKGTLVKLDVPWKDER
jgi:signal transduction histidine kinase